MTSMVEVSPIYMAPIPAFIMDMNPRGVEVPPVYMAPIPSVSLHRANHR